MRILPPILFAALLLQSCQLKPYAPPAQKALVEGVEITTKEFAGRPEIYARVQGRLSTSAAQLVDSPQRRDGNRIYLDIMEQTPRGADLTVDLAHSPEYERIVPIDILGLKPGNYLLSVNGFESVIEVPALTGVSAATEVPATAEVRDEMIAIEDMVLVDPVPATATAPAP